MAKIHQAICDIINDCPAISKDQKNKQQGYMFRGIDVVMTVFQPLLAKHRVFVAPEVISINREERSTKSGGALTYTILQMKYTFYSEDGSSVSAIVQGEAMDSADKSCNKAMSVAFKYALFQMFCIPTEEMKDPDETTPEPIQPAERYFCTKCNAAFKDAVSKSGEKIDARTRFEKSKKICRENNIDGVLCSACYKSELAKESEANNNG